MVEGARWRFPWGTLLSIGMLAAALTGALRGLSVYGPPAPWTGIAGLLVVALCAFIVMRWLISWLAGMTAALAITLSAPFAQAAQTGPAVLPEGLLLFTLACVLAGWRNSFSGRKPSSHTGDVLLWLTITASGVAAAGLAWVLQPRYGLATSLLFLVGFTLGAAVGRKCLSIGWTRVVAAILVAFVVPVGGICVRLFAVPQFCSQTETIDVAILLRQSIEVQGSDFLDSFDLHFNVLLMWMMVALVVWGTWRSLRRGFMDCRAPKMPTAWLLPLFAIINLALLPQCSPTTRSLPIVSSALLLAVFSVGDFFRGIGESLVLRPPYERNEQG